MSDDKRLKQLKVCESCKYLEYTKPFHNPRCNLKKRLVVYIDKCVKW